MIDKYIKNLEQFLSKLEDLKTYAANENFEEEKKDLNRFLIFCFSIINLDTNNISEISQVLYVLNNPDEKRMKPYIYVFEDSLESCPLEERKKEAFKNTLKMEDVNLLLRYDIVDEEIVIPEKCFRYHYIIKSKFPMSR
jgi:hypothetical protein